MESTQRTAVVTGANAGIGRAVSEQLMRRGLRVVMVCRNAGCGAATRDELARATGGDAELVVGDLSTVASTRAAADAVLAACPRLDVLVHNAGLWPSRRVLNEDGVEQAFATNHLAPFLLNHLLEQRLAASAARVVQVSAGIYVKGRIDLGATPIGERFSSLRTYADTKACNLALLPLWAQRWSGTGITVNAVHPGVIRTGLGDRGGPLGVVLRVAKRKWADPEQGAATVVRLAVEPGRAQVSGRYYEELAEAQIAPPAADPALAAALWELAADLTGVESPVPARP